MFYYTCTYIYMNDNYVTHKHTHKESCITNLH